MTAAVLQRGGWILWIFLPFLRRLEACLRVCVVLRLYKVDRSHSCRDATRLCLSAQPWKRFRCPCDVSVTMCPLELALIPVSAGAREAPSVHMFIVAGVRERERLSNFLSLPLICVLLLHLFRLHYYMYVHLFCICRKIVCLNFHR